MSGLDNDQEPHVKRTRISRSIWLLHSTKDVGSWLIEPQHWHLVLGVYRRLSWKYSSLAHGGYYSQGQGHDCTARSHPPTSNHWLPNFAVLALAQAVVVQTNLGGVTVWLDL
eukprot:5915261-Amphidinium_carterae.1